jgi:hypothetical protein
LSLVWALCVSSGLSNRNRFLVCRDRFWRLCLTRGEGWLLSGVVWCAVVSAPPKRQTSTRRWEGPGEYGWIARLRRGCSELQGRTTATVTTWQLVSYTSLLCWCPLELYYRTSAAASCHALAACRPICAGDPKICPPFQIAKVSRPLRIRGTPVSLPSLCVCMAKCSYITILALLVRKTAVRVPPSKFDSRTPYSGCNFQMGLLGLAGRACMHACTHDVFVVSSRNQGKLRPPKSRTSKDICNWALKTTRGHPESNHYLPD